MTVPEQFFEGRVFRERGFGPTAVSETEIRVVEFVSYELQFVPRCKCGIPPSRRSMRKNRFALIVDGECVETPSDEARKYPASGARSLDGAQLVQVPGHECGDNVLPLPPMSSRWRCKARRFSSGLSFHREPRLRSLNQMLVFPLFGGARGRQTGGVLAP